MSAKLLLGCMLIVLPAIVIVHGQETPEMPIAIEEVLAGGTQEHEMVEEVLDTAGFKFLSAHN